METRHRQHALRKNLGVSGVALITLLFICTVVYAYSLPHEDYLFFDYAFRIVWFGHNPSLLYNIQAQHAYLAQTGHEAMVHTYGRYDQFVYPPQFAVLFSWLAAVPARVGALLWAGAALCAYITGVLWTVELACKNGRAKIRWSLYVLAMVQLPFLWDFLIGNSNWLIFFLLVWTFRLETRASRTWLAGIPLGIAAVCKVTPFVLVAYALWRRKWGLAAGALITTAMATGCTVVVLGWHPVWNYLTSIGSLGSMSMKNGDAPYNSSVLGVLGWIGQALGLSLPRAVTAGVVLLFDVFICFLMVAGTGTGNVDPRMDAAWASIGVLILSPLVEGPHMMMAWITLAMVFSIRWERWRSERHRGITVRGAVWLGISVFVVVNLSPLGWPLRTILPVSGFLVMTGLLWMVFREARRDGLYGQTMRRDLGDSISE